MKIDGSQPLHRPTQSDATKPQQTVTDTGTEATSSPASVAHLSSKAQDATRDIDTARVAEIRQAISDGTLEIRPERIADGLLESVQELLG
ncbi:MULTISPECIES: flagellar biosynthesis anti-sigma factor FlgM [Modicisalibacter]|uniref:flagellar biosynthesis anti-sigma factor FlgM n=1 Tax=Modicisalibacter TaxID=574347 RepID=UPI00100A26E4|nr:flagellar biosynthesis anti-sigma factor FlgM [Halomonas coralii]MBZ9557001.1 flagellar biosynthesis anti-sigma factor FlgM [Modicisalibacter sp. R2A 31.J]MBZ9574285.1 flagellar biosynthesis anti-sigma factor FlgM [Modicisalibacter sp. MOD 31.J]